jgi:hypothetical protein
VLPPHNGPDAAAAARRRISKVVVRRSAAKGDAGDPLGNLVDHAHIDMAGSAIFGGGRASLSGHEQVVQVGVLADRGAILAGQGLPPQREIGAGDLLVTW